MSLSHPYLASRIRWIAIAIALAVAAALCGAHPAGAAPRERVSVVVQLDRGADMARAMDDVRRLGGKPGAALSVINGFGADLDARAARELAGLPGVHAVTPNAAVEPQDIKASDVVTAYPFSGDAPNTWNVDAVAATGKGVGVAVIDTGIAGDLADFRVSSSDPSSRVIASAVINPDATRAGDSYGHGTHVAGIIGGNSWNRAMTDLSRGKYIGIAPEANLVDVKVSDEAGNATVLDVIDGLQFVVDHKDQLGIRVVNLSLESGTAQSYRSDPLDAAVESAWFNGIVVVASAGNRGTAADAVSYAPGNDPYVISVGGVDDAGTRANSDDTLASWSARGTTQDGFAKPEITAPGARIVSNLAPNSAFATMCPTCIVTGGMIRAGGTSMSAPVVSGSVALLLERYPQLTPNQVKGVLAGSARMLPGSIPAVDPYAAIRKAAAGSITAANAGLIPNDLVDPASGAIDYTRSSWSRSSWSNAEGSEVAGWSRSSWSRSSWSSTGSGSGSTVDTTRSSWSRSSWSTSWSK